MRKPIAQSVCIAASLILLAAIGRAETEIAPDRVTALLRENPVVCLNPDAYGVCETISSTEIAAASSGRETTVSAYSIDSGFYLMMLTSSDFEIGGEGKCHPSISLDIRASQFLVADGLDAATANTRPLSQAGKEYVDGVFLEPMANALATGTLCVRYYTTGDPRNSSSYILRSFLDGQRIQDDVHVRLFPAGSMSALALKPRD